jgi:branched-chain amino acid transport system substrate-binding protein
MEDGRRHVKIWAVLLGTTLLGCGLRVDEPGGTVPRADGSSGAGHAALAPAQDAAAGSVPAPTGGDGPVAVRAPAAPGGGSSRRAPAASSSAAGGRPEPERRSATGTAARGPAVDQPSGQPPAAGGPARQPATAAAPPTPTKSEIRLGSIGVASGPLGYALQPIRDASKAWVATVNNRGGLNGHPLRLLFGDDAADPARAIALAKRFVESDKVQAMFGLHMPTTEQAIIPYLQERQIPTLGTCNCNPATDDNPLAFNVGPGATAGLAWEHLLSVLGQADVKKIAVLYCRETGTCDAIYKNMRPFTDKLGVQIVQATQVSLAQPDYTAEVLSARNAGAEAIIAVVENQSSVRILRSARRQGWDVPVGSQRSVMDDRMLALPDAKGLHAAVATVDYQTGPGFEEYRQAIGRLPGAVKGNTGSLQWAVGMMFEKASKLFGDTVTSVEIIEGMYSLRNETLGGLVPPTTYKRGVPPKYTNLCAIPVVIGDGRFDFPTGSSFRCAPGWQPVQP